MRLIISMFVSAMSVACFCGCGADSTDESGRNTPQEFAEAFAAALFNDTDGAYSLFEDSFQAKTSPKDLNGMVKMMLPPAKTVTSVKFMGIEEFTEQDGAMVFEASFEVRSSDDFQPKCKMGVHVIPMGDSYRVRRFTVSSLPEG